MKFRSPARDACLIGLALCALTACKPRTADVARALEGEPEASSSATLPAGTDIDSWLKAHPLEAAAWKSSSKMEKSPSGYGGSILKERSAAQPELSVNYKGSAYAVSFKTIRGHVYSWADITATKRVTDKTPASCITCKTPEIASLYAEGGWSFAQKPAKAFFDADHPAIDCFSCHDPATQALRTTVPSFAEAMKRRGVDLAKAGPKDMENYVCAQCHSTYYIEPKTNRIVAPWDKGLDPKSMLAYYATKPAGFEKDFDQPDSGVAALKARHPDYELYAGSVHASAGVSCVDCHMPYVSKDGRQVRDHFIRSPLLNIQASCLACHRGKTEDWIKERVAYIQDSVFEEQRLAGARVAAAHAAIAAAAGTGAAQSKLDKARAEVREGQWYWDYVASSNSMGFHNSVLAMGSLAKALDLASRAIEDLSP